MVSVVGEKAPAQAVDSLTVGDIVIALETWAVYLGRLLNSEDYKMSVGHCAISDLVGIVCFRNSPFLFGSII